MAFWIRTTLRFLLFSENRASVRLLSATLTMIFGEICATAPLRKRVEIHAGFNGEYLKRPRRSPSRNRKLKMIGDASRKLIVVLLVPFGRHVSIQPAPTVSKTKMSHLGIRWEAMSLNTICSQRRIESLLETVLVQGEVLLCDLKAIEMCARKRASGK